jgi:hypothetical protein
MRPSLVLAVASRIILSTMSISEIPELKVDTMNTGQKITSNNIMESCYFRVRYTLSGAQGAKSRQPVDDSV